MKIVKHNRIAVLRQRGFASLAVRSITVCAITACCLTTARAAGTLPLKDPASQAAPVQKAAYTPQGRQMGRYKTFARQAEMPAITAADKTTLLVGETLKTDITTLARLSTRHKEALAGQFSVPPGVIDKLVQRLSNAPQWGADQVAQELRTAVIDYRFLQGEWGRYHPPPEGQQIKANALAALQTGDISKAWDLYDGLPKPQAPGIVRPRPPTNLRIVSQ